MVLAFLLNAEVWLWDGLSLDPTICNDLSAEGTEKLLTKDIDAVIEVVLVEDRHGFCGVVLREVVGEVGILA